VSRSKRRSLLNPKSPLDKLCLRTSLDLVTRFLVPSKLLRCNSTGPTVLANRSQDEDKSTFQKVGDSTRSNADSAQNEGGSFLDSTKDTLSGVASSASDTLSNAGKCPSSQL
jgi:hypothetical protein